MLLQAVLASTLTAMAAAVPSQLHHQHKRAESSSSYSAKGIAYTPYANDGTCKSAETVASDLEKISDYPLIRLYGTDCDQIASVFKAKGKDQKLFLELYDMSTISDEVEIIKSGVESHGSWDDVDSVTVGNELVNSGLATVSQVGEYVSTAKSALKAAGYSGPVVAVDTFIAVINNPGLCEYSDYMAINAHAYFDGNVEAKDAGEWVLQQIQRVWSACGGEKHVFVSESGWPHQGDTYKKAVASKESQAAALSSISEVCGNDTVLFSAYNDEWKQPGVYGVEQYWGVL